MSYGIIFEKQRFDIRAIVYQFRFHIKSNTKLLSNKEILSVKKVAALWMTLKKFLLTSMKSAAWQLMTDFDMLSL